MMAEPLPRTLIRLDPNDDNQLGEYLTFFNARKPHRACTLEDERQNLSVIDRHALFALRVGDGSIAASGAIWHWEDIPDNQAYASVLHDGTRATGDIEQLVGALTSEDWVAGCTLYVVLVEGDHAQLDWWESHGLKRHSEQLQVSLDIHSRPLPPDVLPDGFSVVTLAARPDLLRASWELRHEAARDIPGDEDDLLPDFEAWLSMAERLGITLDNQFVMLDEAGTAVGYASMLPRPAIPGQVRHGMTAIARSHRGRGLGRAFKHFLIRNAAERGYDSIGTTNEERNAPIRHLNDSLGYLPEPAIIVLKGPLPQLSSRGATA